MTQNLLWRNLRPDPFSRKLHPVSCYSQLTGTCNRMSEPETRSGDCLVREATVDDFSAISAVVRRSGLRSPAYANWVRLWNDNPFRPKVPAPVGWLLENEAKQIVGTFSNIVRMYSYNGETVRVATPSAWAVDPPYSAAAVLLAKQFFSQKNIDVFLNTTASAAAAEIFKAFRCSEIPDPSYTQVLFWVTDPEGFAGSVLRKLRAPAIPGLKYIVEGALRCRDLFHRRAVRFRRLDTCLLTCFDQRFDAFWDILRVRRDRLLAVRTAEALTWQFRPFLEDNSAVVLSAMEGGAMVGYLIMIRGDDDQLGLRRLRIVDLQTARDDADVILSLMASARQHAERIKIHVVESVGFHQSKRRVLERLEPQRRSYSSCPYLYKVKTASQPLRDALRNPDVWDASQFDGDASL